MQGLHQGHCGLCCQVQLMVGEEMMQQFTRFNFKALALVATILTSSKHSDGISRLVTKSDLDKMKGSLQENAIKMEDLLHEAWNKLQMDTSLKDIVVWETCCQAHTDIAWEAKAQQGGPL